ncbi:hypothetical protein M6D81_01220 [Paenibacillus sp. J5C_2022]|uniref:hypothetical protein n=1 Tax=Paenibacillus sp. J5C2022 TaxID=2977129 RepID=UPI0021D15786|nr:hypothetical protein [Paenibacillus sp. J5C2022]MCU6707315.1 hypothetical protein [Paenibacillus sp. J5C2022]
MKWRLLISIGLAVVIMAAIWTYHNRDEAVYQRIVQQDGYTLGLVKEGVETEFFLKPEWIPEKSEGENKLHLVVDEKFDTEIVLERVLRRGNNISIELNTIPDPDRNSGQFLSIYQIVPESFISTRSREKWVVTDHEGNDLLKGRFSAGSGPGNYVSVTVKNVEIEKLRQGGHIRYSGYYLYGYRSETGELAPYVFPGFLIILLIVVLTVIYHKHKEPEKGLAWKLVGYLLLGGFTFSLNGIHLPLGFVAYLLFFRDAKSNSDMKLKAAMLGLLLYAVQLIPQTAVGALDFTPKNMVIRDVSLEQLGHHELMKMLAARVPISDQANMESFETDVTHDGEVKSLMFQLVDRDERGRYILYHAEYNAVQESIALSRSSSDTWVQYPRQIRADDFFHTLERLQLMKLTPATDDYKLVKIAMPEGEPWNYAIKDTPTFGVDDEGIYEIKTDQFPVQGMFMYACVITKTSATTSQCMDKVNYLFNIMGGTLRSMK